MAQNTAIRSARRAMGLIACLAAIGMVSLSGQASAHASGGHASGGHSGGGHGGGAHFGGGGGHFGGHGGYAHGYGYGHGGYGYGYGHGGFYRAGHHYYYNTYGVLVEDCCYVAPVIVAPYGVYVP